MKNNSINAREKKKKKIRTKENLPLLFGVGENRKHRMRKMRILGTKGLTLVPGKDMEEIILSVITWHVHGIRTSSMGLKQVGPA